MTPQLRSLTTVIGVLLLVAAGAGWWAYRVTQVPTITTNPPVGSRSSPLSSPVLDQLKTRSIVGEIPVANPGSSHRVDPFSK